MQPPRRRIVAFLLVIATGSCAEPIVAPPAKPAPPRALGPGGPASNLVQDSTLVTDSLLREVVVQLPESGSADSDLVVNLWYPGELNGPAVIEVAGAFRLDAGAVPVTNALTSGALLWYKQSIVTAPPVHTPLGGAPSRGPVPGDVVLITLVRQAALSFEAMPPGDSAVREGVAVSGPKDSVRVVDTAAASHGMLLRWAYLNGDNSLGFPENLDSACAYVGPFGCAPLPPRDSAFLSNGQPHGAVRIRVYRAGQSVRLTVDTAYGPNPQVAYGASGSFTTLPGENLVSLRATVSPATLGSAVRWIVRPASDAALETQAPSTPAAGALSQFIVPSPLNPAGRWQAYPYPSGLEVKRLGYEVTAAVTSGGAVVESTLPPKRVEQDEIDIVRQEYIDLGLWQGPPPRPEFVGEPPVTPHLVGDGLNTGDYGVMVFNNAFVTHMDQLSTAWTAYGAWQISSQYRNPAHQRFHIARSSNPGFNSWHVYGCAADIRISGATAGEDTLLWNDMHDLAKRLGFDDVEKMSMSGVGHVHVEYHFCR